MSILSFGFYQYHKPEVQKRAQILGLVLNIKAKSEAMIPQNDVFAGATDFGLFRYFKFFYNISFVGQLKLK